MKVGTLARKTGVSVRTLHYYDEIGLLAPARRTEAGHRLYGADDAVRLQQIVSLRQLGFSLDEIRVFLEGVDGAAHRVIELHLARLNEQMALQRRLYDRLEALAAHLRAAEEVSVDDILQTIADMNMIEKYYTPEQLEALRQRREHYGEEQIRRFEAEWQDLIAAAQAEREKGTDPASEPVQRLARRWMELVQAFTGGNPGIQKSLNVMYRQEGPAAASRGMVDPALFDYMGEAIAALHKSG